MIKTTTSIFKNYIIHTWDSILSYFTVLLGFISNVDLMDAGAGLLLVIRLLIDVPRAYKSLTGKTKANK